MHFVTVTVTEDVDGHRASDDGARRPQSDAFALPT